MCIRTNDPAADYDRYDAEREASLERLPKCDYCDKYIQDDCFYEINEEVICEECINDNFRKSVDDYVE